MEVLVFKTNVLTEKDQHQVRQILNSVESVSEWNFDLDDCDKILRVVARNIPAELIESLLNDAGISCKELMD